MTNREAWLINAVEAMTPWITELDLEVPPMRVSVGWPGGRAPRTTVGQCWPTTTTEDGIAQIFMSPVRGKDSTVDVLGTLLHEMVHAVDDCENAHNKGFIAIARPLGFAAKWTSSSNRTEELTERLTGLAERLGEFPSAAIVGGKAADTPKTQTTRMLKLEAACCGYTVRTTKKWIEQGMPSCPCGTEMEQT